MKWITNTVTANNIKDSRLTILNTCRSDFPVGNKTSSNPNIMEYDGNKRIQKFENEGLEYPRADNMFIDKMRMATRNQLLRSLKNTVIRIPRSVKTILEMNARTKKAIQLKSSPTVKTTIAKA